MVVSKAKRVPPHPPTTVASGPPPSATRRRLPLDPVPPALRRAASSGRGGAAVSPRAAIPTAPVLFESSAVDVTTRMRMAYNVMGAKYDGDYPLPNLQMLRVMSLTSTAPSPDGSVLAFPVTEKGDHDLFWYAAHDKVFHGDGGTLLTSISGSETQPVVLAVIQPSEVRKMPPDNELVPRGYVVAVVSAGYSVREGPYSSATPAVKYLTGEVMVRLPVNMYPVDVGNQSNSRIRFHRGVFLIEVIKRVTRGEKFTMRCGTRRWCVALSRISSLRDEDERYRWIESRQSQVEDGNVGLLLGEVDTRVAATLSSERTRRGGPRVVTKVLLDSLLSEANQVSPQLNVVRSMNEAARLLDVTQNPADRALDPSVSVSETPKSALASPPAPPLQPAPAPAPTFPPAPVPEAAVSRALAPEPAPLPDHTALMSTILSTVHQLTQEVAALRDENARLRERPPAATANATPPSDMPLASAPGVTTTTTAPGMAAPRFPVPFFPTGPQMGPGGGVNVTLNFVTSPWWGQSQQQ